MIKYHPGPTLHQLDSKWQHLGKLAVICRVCLWFPTTEKNLLMPAYISAAYLLKLHLRKKKSKKAREIFKSLSIRVLRILFDLSPASKHLNSGPANFIFTAFRVTDGYTVQ